MEFTDVIRTRHSIRAFADKSVEEEKLLAILECARLSPSWMNKQCWRFIVIRKKETIAQITKATLINRWLKTAPMLIIACADPTESGMHNDIPYYAVDVAIAFQHLILAATDQGLGTCWIGGFDEEKIKEILQIPKRIRVIAFTPLGYPAEKKGIADKIATTLIKSSRRKTLDEIIHYEHW